MHTLCHAPGCAAGAVRGWTHCARHYTSGNRRSESDSVLNDLTTTQRRIHADVQLHGVRHYGRRSLPAVTRLFDLGLVLFEYAPLHDETVKVMLPPSESARLKGPWRRDELRRRMASQGDML